MSNIRHKERKGGTNLEVAKLGELLSAVVQETPEGLFFPVGDLVRADVASLGEAFVADITREGFFSGMTALVSLRLG